MKFLKVTDLWIWEVSLLDPLCYFLAWVTISTKYIGYVSMVHDWSHLYCTTISDLDENIPSIWNKGIFS